MVEHLRGAGVEVGDGGCHVGHELQSVGDGEGLEALRGVKGVLRGVKQKERK